MSNAAPNTAGSPWAQAPEAAGDEAEGFTILGIDVARVAKVPLRRWKLTFLAVLISLGGAAYAYTKKEEQWRITAFLVYEPHELQVGQRKIYTPHEFPTVLNLVKDRGNFDQLGKEFPGLSGIDPILLANVIFKIEAVATTIGDSRNIQIAYQTEDKGEGEEIVKRLIKICQARQLEARQKRLDELYDLQKKILVQKDQDVKKPQAALADYLKEKGYRDDAALKLEMESWSRKAQNDEQAMVADEKALKDIQVQIKDVQKKLEDLKANKAEVSAADKQAYKDRQENLQSSIQIEENNLVGAKKELARAESKLSTEQRLLEGGSGTPKAVKDAKYELELTQLRVQSIEQGRDRLKKSLAELKPASTGITKYLDQLDNLELNRTTAESRFNRSKLTFDHSQERATGLVDLYSGVKPRLKAIEEAEKERDTQNAMLLEIRNTRDIPIEELKVTSEPLASRYASTNAKKMLAMGFGIPFAVLLALLVGFEMTTTGWKAESLAETLRLPLLARSSGSRRAGALSPTETRGLSLRIRQYVPDAGGIVLLSSLNDGPGIDQLVSDLSRYFAARDEKVLVLDARIANTEGDMLPRLLGRQVVRGAVEVVPDGQSTMRGKVGSVVVSGLVQYLVFEGMDPAGFICPTRIPAVDYMAAGGPYVLTDVLASQPMKDLLETLRRRYSLVLVVGPSATKSIDTEILAAYVSGIVFIINSPIKTATPAVQEFLVSLKEANAPLLGSVVCV
jgi:Mrp family chromosome partitioning ATPase